MRKSIKQRISQAAHSKVRIRITDRIRCEKGFDVIYPDATCPDGHDCINVGSKGEALTLLLIKARIFGKQRFEIRPASTVKADLAPKVPWCKDCRTYHAVPKSKEEHEGMDCRAIWRER